MYICMIGITGREKCRNMICGNGLIETFDLSDSMMSSAETGEVDFPVLLLSDP